MNTHKFIASFILMLGMVGVADAYDNDNGLQLLIACDYKFGKTKEKIDICLSGYWKWYRAGNYLDSF